MALNEGLNDFSLEGKAALVIGAEHSGGPRRRRSRSAEAGAKLVLASQEPGTDEQLKEAAKNRAARPEPRRRVSDVQSAVIRADVRATIDLRSNAARRSRHPGQRARHPSLRAGRSERRYRVRPSHGEQSQDRLDGVPGGRGARCSGRGGGVDRQHHLGAGGARRAERERSTARPKAAVLNLTRALALEWARKNIRVNASRRLDDRRGEPGAGKDDEFAQQPAQVPAVQAPGQARRTGRRAALPGFARVAAS